jgi:hypothetical protein
MSAFSGAASDLPASPGAETQRPEPTREAPRPPLINEITIEHGPRDLLGRFFLKADTAARQRGVTLSFGTMEELQQANERNRATWKPLVPLLSPRYNDLGPETAYCILGRNAAGEIVATQAGRIFSWPDTSFYEEARSLRLFYGDPRRQALPGEVCDITAMATKAVSGRVAFSGGGWYRRDFRKRWLAGILPRISRAYAYTRWRTDFTTTVMDKGVFEGGFGRRAGYTNADWVLDWRNTPLGDMYLGFLWMKPEQLLGDLREFLASFDAEVDAVVDNRSAQYG